MLGLGCEPHAACACMIARFLQVLPDLIVHRKRPCGQTVCFHTFRYRNSLQRPSAPAVEAGQGARQGGRPAEHARHKVRSPFPFCLGSNGFAVSENDSRPPARACRGLCSAPHTVSRTAHECGDPIGTCFVHAMMQKNEVS